MTRRWEFWFAAASLVAVAVHLALRHVVRPERWFFIVIMVVADLIILRIAQRESRPLTKIRD